MTAVVFSFTHKGSKLSLAIAQLLKRIGYSVQQYAMLKYCIQDEQQPIEPSLSKLSKQVFSTANVLVYIGATGIAVRAIAPVLVDKKTDPAVICIDELGMFTIPLLSGHIGGANRLAKYLAREIESTAVITTATDINDLPAIDEWATLNKLYITDMLMAKNIAAMLLDGEPIGISSSYRLAFELPAGFVPSEKTPTGIYISGSKHGSPYQNTLYLMPRNIHLGIGCRRGISATAIESLVTDKLKELGIDIGRVSKVASIDLKANEAGLLEFISKYNFQKAFYSAEQLRQVAGSFNQSEFVNKITGVDNVCERAAIFSSGGRLLQHKCSQDGVTLAVAVEA